LKNKFKKYLKMASFTPLPPYSGITPNGVFPIYPPLPRDVRRYPRMPGKFPGTERDVPCEIKNGWNTIPEPRRRKVGLGYGSISFSMYGRTGPGETFTDAGGRRHATFPQEYVYLPEDTMYSGDRRRYDAAGRLQSYGFMAYPYRDWAPWIEEKYISTLPIPVPSLFHKSRSMPPTDE
jgi:hypothetical protein